MVAAGAGHNELGDEAGPAGLVRRAEANAAARNRNIVRIPTPRRRCLGMKSGLESFRSIGQLADALLEGPEGKVTGWRTWRGAPQQGARCPTRRPSAVCPHRRRIFTVRRETVMSRPTTKCCHHHPEAMTRRKMSLRSLFALFAGLGTLMVDEKKAKAGYGPCSISGCPCQGFMPTPGNSYMCENCGHNYSMHW